MKINVLNILIVVANTGFATSIVIQADDGNICSAIAEPEADSV